MMDQQFKKDYKQQIIDKLDILSTIKDKNIFASDMNDFINMMNYSFLMKNDFFIENFNKKVIRIIYPAYNKIKTNIITNTCKYLFESLTKQQLKSIRFIILNAINNYEKIPCQLISKNSLFHCLTAINEALNIIPD